MSLSINIIRRLCLIYQELGCLGANGRRYVFADEIADRTGTTTFLVRQAINSLGVRQRRRGYEIDDLYGFIGEKLGLIDRQKAVLVGVGRLGSALLNLKNSILMDCDYIAAFDCDTSKTGKKVAGIPVLPEEEIGTFLADNPADFGIVCVPIDAAQTAVDRLVEAGIPAILNLASANARVPEGIIQHRVDISLELMALLALGQPREAMADSLAAAV